MTNLSQLTAYERAATRTVLRVLTSLVTAFGALYWADIIVGLGYRTVTVATGTGANMTSTLKFMSPEPAVAIAIFLVYPLAFIFIITALGSTMTRVVVHPSLLTIATEVTVFAALIVVPTFTGATSQSTAFLGDSVLLILSGLLSQIVVTRLGGLAVLAEPHYKALLVATDVTSLSRKVLDDRAMRKVLGVGSPKTIEPFTVFSADRGNYRQVHLILRPAKDPQSTEVRIITYTAGRFAVIPSETDDYEFMNTVDFFTKMVKQNIGAKVTVMKAKDDEVKADALRLGLRPADPRIAAFVRVPNVALVVGMASLGVVLMLFLELVYPSTFDVPTVIGIIGTIIVFGALEVNDIVRSHRESLL